MDTLFGREGSEGSKGSKGSEGSEGSEGGGGGFAAVFIGCFAAVVGALKYGWAPLMIEPENRAFVARGKHANQAAPVGNAFPPCPLRGTSPKGKRVTGFSVAQGLPTNPVPLPPRKREQNNPCLK